MGAVNNALTTLNNLDLRWHGSSMKEQRSDAMKNRIISVTEKMMLSVATTVCQTPQLLDDGDDMEKEALREQSDDVGFRSVRHSRSATPRVGRSGRSTPLGSSRHGVRSVSVSRSGSRCNSPRQYGR